MVGLLRLAQCMETAKHFGNYRDCIGLCDMVVTFEVEEQTETA